MGTVTGIDTNRGDRRFWMKTPWEMKNFSLGASIACSGCCLTVVEKNDDSFAVDVSAESLSKTTLGSWKVGTPVNLESSLRLGDELGGHIVSGHVDGLARIMSITPDGDSRRVVLMVPEHLKHFLAPKGSAALDGISLTVNTVDDNQFSVNIIPHTWTVTTFAGLDVGDHMNFEVDMLARYVARMMGKS